MGTGLVGLLSDEFQQLGKHIAAGAGFISNFVLWQESGYFDKAAEYKPRLHLWSLGIEKQFYCSHR
jgi:peptidoglycan/LPS O-acetylase OafA/YrhL